MRPLPWARLAWALLGSAAIAGCGSAEPRPATPRSATGDEPARPGPSDRQQPAAAPPLAAGPEPGASAGCDASCAGLIDEAERRLDQADAMKDEAAAYAAFASRAGRAFLKAWRGCLLEVPDGTDLACKGGREVVANMVRAFAPSDDDDGGIVAILVALDPRWASDAGPARDQLLTELRDAAARAEKTALKDIRGEHAAERLEAAAYGRIALGEMARAREDVALYRRKIPQRRKEALLLVAAIAAHDNDQSSFAAALGGLGPAPAPSDDARAVLLWHAEHGRALAGSKRTDQAAAELDRVLASWPADQRAATKLAGPMAPRPMPDREWVVDAIGAALFFRAEQKRLAAEALSPPPYSGPQTADGFNQFIKTRIAEWAGKKQSLVGDAVRAYQQIAGMQPAVSRRWLVSASSHAGRLFAGYIEQFKGIGVPAVVAKDPALRAAYDRSVQASLVPLVDAARSAFTACTERAKRFQVQNDDTRACTAWLEQNAK